MSATRVNIPGMKTKDKNQSPAELIEAARLAKSIPQENAFWREVSEQLDRAEKRGTSPLVEKKLTKAR